MYVCKLIHEKTTDEKYSAKSNIISLNDICVTWKANLVPLEVGEPY